MKLSVIIPVYNEEGTIREIINQVRAVDLGDIEKEIIVVDDGSTDRTREILAEEVAKYEGKHEGHEGEHEGREGERERHEGEFRVFYHEHNQGKGGAVQTGLAHATGDIILIQDADLEYDPREYPQLLRPILEGRSQVVYGSRFLGGPRKAMFFWHMVGNKFLTLVTNILYDTILSDMETCYKVFTAEVARQLNLKSKGWGFDPEITAKILKRGYRIYEVPISYTGREYHEGKKISWRDAFTVLWTLLKYRFVD